MTTSVAHWTAWLLMWSAITWHYAMSCSERRTGRQNDPMRRIVGQYLREAARVHARWDGTESQRCAG